MTSRILVAAGAITALGVLLIAAGVARDALVNPAGYVHPRPRGFRYHDDPWTRHRLAFDDVTLTDNGRGALRGWLVPGAADATRAVVWLHGTGSDRTHALPFLPALHEAGAAVLAVDLRENGLSDGAGRGSGLGMREAEDADRAVAELWRRGYRTMVLMGVSLGATAAIIAGAQNPRVAAVIAEDPVASFLAFRAAILRRRFGRLGLDPPAALVNWWGDAVVRLAMAHQGMQTLVDAEAAAGHLGPRPLLIINGAADTVVPPEHSTRIFLAAAGPRDLLRIPGADHGQSIVVAPQLVTDRIVAFIRSLPEGRPVMSVAD
ncbi:alpha/beta hydrolase [Dankookia sp. GCM10030260]|uniref:alpha/beta hydrolase n=1 Tax=Dankookia sp. GCM10030260 TaxID=3273390 RepID=UPI00360CC486